MRRVALSLALTAGLACASGAALAQDPAPPPAAEAEAKTVEKTASPELVGQLVKDLAITPAQAEGAAGALFGLARTRLTADEFAKVAGAVPNMEGLLKAAPVADGKVAAMASAAGGAAGMASLAGSFSKLGIKPDTVAKLAPTLAKAVESKGGAEVGKLLLGALK
jgi:Protein of unknown function VcgC/VcgE (DUF2780)